MQVLQLIEILAIMLAYSNKYGMVYIGMRRQFVYWNAIHHINSTKIFFSFSFYVWFTDCSQFQWFVISDYHHTIIFIPIRIRSLNRLHAVISQTHSNLNFKAMRTFLSLNRFVCLMCQKRKICELFICFQFNYNNTG